MPLTTRSLPRERVPYRSGGAARRGREGPISVRRPGGEGGERGTRARSHSDGSNANECSQANVDAHSKAVIIALLHGTRLVRDDSLFTSIGRLSIPDRRRSRSESRGCTRGAAHEVRSDVGRVDLAFVRLPFVPSPICIGTTLPAGAELPSCHTRKAAGGPHAERPGRTTQAGSPPTALRA